MDEVANGYYQAMLSEPAVCWVMTRGTTGKPKILPATKTHLDQILTIGARAVVNFALSRDQPEVLAGQVLNLNFPSVVATLNTKCGGVPYGYSSGTYARFNPELGSARLIPKQEEIDALGGGITKKDWENRFEFVYEKARDRDVKSLMGVTPVLAAFARYVHGKHRVLPSQLWKLKALFCTSVAKIQTDYAPLLSRFYSQVPVVEMYTATEGVFAQQLDMHPYVSPNYDAYLFEVKTRGRVRLLHELKPGDWGRLIVSTPSLPRYDVGDFVEALGKNYFRIFGRASWRTLLEHYTFNILTLRGF